MALRYCKVCKTEKDETAFKYFKLRKKHCGYVCGKCRYQLEKPKRATPEYRAKQRVSDSKRLSRPEAKAKQKAHHAKYMARPEIRARLKAKYAEYYNRPDVAARRKARMAAYYQRPEVKARINAKNKTRSPKRVLHSRVHAAIYTTLRTTKGGREWQALVGYSVDELRKHLERQFLKGMSWQNIGEWHIDHIVPVAAFDYEVPEDPNFSACWALTNLRPLWREENQSKGAKRLYLL